MRSLKELIKMVDAIAHARYGGHWTLMSFSGHYKVMFDTPHLGAPTMCIGPDDKEVLCLPWEQRTGYDEVMLLSAHPTIDAALEDLLNREERLPHQNHGAPAEDPAKLQIAIDVIRVELDKGSTDDTTGFGERVMWKAQCCRKTYERALAQLRKEDEFRQRSRT